MTVYNIGPGQTYTTFTALEAAVVLAGDDIVDGGGNTFNEKWLPQTDGTTGHQIVLRNATIDVASAIDYCVDFTNRGYLTLQNIIVKNATSRNIWSDGTDTGIILDNVQSDNGLVGMWIRAKSTSSYSNITINDGSGTYAFYLSNPSTDVTVNGLIVDNSPRTEFGGITNLSVSNVTITNSKNRGLGVITVLGNLLINTFSINGSAESQSLGSFVIDQCTLGTLNVSNGTVANESVSNGFLVRNCTFSGSALISNINCTYNKICGFYIRETSGLVFSTITANYNDDSGFLCDSTAAGKTISLSKAVLNNNKQDGLSTKLAIILTATGIEASNNGTAGSVNSGDGITSHDTSTLNAYFALTKGNLNSGSAHIGTPTVTIYHQTSINNGSDGFSRGEFWSQCTGGTQTIKNSVLMNTNGYPLIKLQDTNTIYPVSDYNCYISNSLTPFYDGNQSAGDEALTFAEWITASSQDANSIFIHKDGVDYDVYLGSAPAVVSTTLSYCPVGTDGKLIYAANNPLINSGLFIDGVNNQNYPDPWGETYNLALPNIGADQGTGNRLQMIIGTTRSTIVNFDGSFNPATFIGIGGSDFPVAHSSIKIKKVATW